MSSCSQRLDSPKILATIRSFDELQSAFEKRSAEISAQPKQPWISPVTNDKGLLALTHQLRARLGPILTCMGVVLVLVEDPETRPYILRRLAEARNEKLISRANLPLPTQKSRKKHHFNGCSDWGRMARAEGIKKLSKYKRSRIAAKAGKASAAARRAKKQEVQAT